MRHIKLFEELDKDEPKIGDYVIANAKYASKVIQNFFLTHIGKIISVDKAEPLNTIEVEYDDEDVLMSDGVLLDNNRWNFVYNSLKLTELLHWSKNIEDLEDILTAKKYNL